MQPVRVRNGFVPSIFDRGAEGVVILLATRGTVSDVCQDAVAGGLSAGRISGRTHRDRLEIEKEEWHTRFPAT